MELYQFNHKIEQLIPSINDINKEMLDLLTLFTYQRLSIYRIHKIIEKYVRKMTYKNTHKKVKRLIDLKLIELEKDSSKTNENEIDRGAKYYKLSEEGIFVLFYNSNVLLRPSIYYVQRAFDEGKIVEDVYDIFASYKKEIFRNYSNCIFFDLFLFPWISMDTVENADEKIIDLVIMSLNHCCNAIEYHVLKSSPVLYDYSDIGTIASLIAEIKDQERILNLESINKDDPNLLSFVEEFDYEGSRIKRIKRGENKNNILLARSYYPNSLLLAYVDKENRSNIISFYRNTEGSSLFKYSLRHKLISIPMFDIIEEDIKLQSLYFKAVFSIVDSISKDDDLKPLKDDLKFMETLNEIKGKFDSGYELLTR